MTEFLSLAVRPWLRYLGLAFACFALGAAVGRYLTPPKVVTKTEIKTQIVTRDVIKTVTVAARARDRVRTTRTTVTPTEAGPVTVTETETRTSDRSNETTTGTEVSKSTTETDARTTRVVSAPKSWYLAPMLGVGNLGPGLTPSPVVGAEFSGRVWGPVRVGGWGLYETRSKVGAAGVSLGVEF